MPRYQTGDWSARGTGRILQSPGNGRLVTPVASAALSLVSGYASLYTPASIQHSGGGVTGWNDTSGNGYNFTSAGGGPSYLSSGINGQPGVGFLASSSQVVHGGPLLSSLVGAAGSAFTIYLVFNISSYTGSSNLRNGNAGVFGDTGGYVQIGPGSTAFVTTMWYSGSSDNLLASTGPALNTTCIYQCVCSPGGGLIVNINGSTQSTAFAALGSTSGNVELGSSEDGLYFSGTLALVCTYASALSSTNQNTNLTNLNAVFG